MRTSIGSPVPGSSSDLSTRKPSSCSCRLRSEEHTSELQSRLHLVCRLLLDKNKNSTGSANVLANCYYPRGRTPNVSHLRLALFAGHEIPLTAPHHYLTTPLLAGGGVAQTPP